MSVHTKTNVRKLPYTVILAVLASIVVLVWHHSPLAGGIVLPEHVETSASTTIPDISFETDAGKTVRLSDQKDKVTILHFWASWCPPCITELPTLDAFAGVFKDKEVQFVVVSLDNEANRAKAKAFYKAHNITHLPLLFGNQMEVMRAIKLKGLPTSIFIVNKQEVSRANADLDWGDAAMAAYINALSARGK